ncbi:MAG TPA: L-seryl-tRNA(Sec) selenium transferase, partial [Gemmatimonadaceae bacterium]|nr:L-seryl-tRNA(Sec) selenium transferase [Gemmatimonadaceae bacterium]
LPAVHAGAGRPHATAGAIRTVLHGADRASGTHGARGSTDRRTGPTAGAMTTDARRALPSVGTLLESDALRPLVEGSPRGLVTDAVRATIDAVRRAELPPPTDLAGWASAIARTLAVAERPSLRPVLNATGVVLHTNLGRAALADVALEAIARVARGHSNLEYDLDVGARGSRYDHCAGLLRELTGAEDGLVVNNGAAALVLALDSLCHGRDAVVSRGELVEIGGSFRIPDIMGKSGARLREVGTTNRTHLADYRAALDEGAGAMVKVHRSNFAMAGFVAEASARELAALGRERGVPLLHDLGSGLLLPLDDIGLTGEPTAREAVADGATLVLMSGDKLLGGPQAGIIVGTRIAIAALRANPLIRSYRVDKLTLAALEATLALYRDPARARRQIPTLAMLGAPVDVVRRRAERLAARLGGRATVVASEATVGGGAFPTARIDSAALAFDGDAPPLERALRAGDPAVVGRVADRRLLLDLRSILPRDDDALGDAVERALSATGAAA